MSKRKNWEGLLESGSIGKGTYGNPTVAHWGEEATLTVGNYCSIAINVRILIGGNHRMDWVTTYPFPRFRDSARHITDFVVSRGSVTIGHDVWIGENVTILSGVTIGNGAVIGASAVVTKGVPPYTIVAGNPARKIGVRFSKGDVEILQSLEWWYWDDAKLDAGMGFLLSSDIRGLRDFSLDYDSRTK